MAVFRGQGIRVALGPFTHRSHSRNSIPPTSRAAPVPLGNQRLTSVEWQKVSNMEEGVEKTRFYPLKSGLQKDGKIQNSMVDKKWEQIRRHFTNSDRYDRQ